MRVLVFGTYEKWRYPRIQALMEGLRAHGDEVAECNVPLDLSTDERVRLLRRPWRLPSFAFRLGMAWARLWRRARARGSEPDVVLVPHMGHFDVHLARALWPTTPIALDHLISASGTARDRRAARGWMRSVLRAVDRRAVKRADVVIVDTEENRRSLPGRAHRRAVVVPVGAPAAFFSESGARGGPSLRVGFFGIYTPLHGTGTIADAIARLRSAPVEFVMVGRGQEWDRARAVASVNPAVRWIDWLPLDELREEVAGWDVCLGIFGTTPKALRVVPQKVVLGAALGAAVVTSDTGPQRRALDDAALYVPPGDAETLAATLASLADDPERLEALQRAARARARSRFHPDAVVAELRERLAGLVPERADEQVRSGNRERDG